jgi:trehalose/maltose hydrolase-like predicted phosphorylase
MVIWIMEKAFRIMRRLKSSEKERILEALSLTEKNLEQWKQIMQGLSIHVSDEGIVEQFKGYFELDELDWDYYRERYGDIHRLDRILKAEGKSPDDYKLAKQADFLMSFYNLGTSEVTKILKEMGMPIPRDYTLKNFNYYIQRTSHGSTLSRLVHARLAWEFGMRDVGWELYMEALRSDLVDIQGGTTGEGIHCGVMAGTVYNVIYTYAGLNLNGEIPALSPNLPDHWKALDFKFNFRSTHFQVSISGKRIKISGKNAGKDKIKVHLCGKEIELPQEVTVVESFN